MSGLSCYCEHLLRAFETSAAAAPSGSVKKKKKNVLLSNED
jgi:hypothetical protein